MNQQQLFVLFDYLSIGATVLLRCHRKINVYVALCNVFGSRGWGAEAYIQNSCSPSVWRALQVFLKTRKISFWANLMAVIKSRRLAVTQHRLSIGEVGSHSKRAGSKDGSRCESSRTRPITGYSFPIRHQVKASLSPSLSLAERHTFSFPLVPSSLFVFVPLLVLSYVGLGALVLSVDTPAGRLSRTTYV